MKKHIILITLFLIFLTSCKEHNPKNIVIKILHYAQNEQKDKIFEMMNPNIWVGNIKSDGTHMTKEETVDELIIAVKGRVIKDQEAVNIVSLSEETVVLDYEDLNFVNGNAFQLMVILVKVNGEFYIGTMEF